MKKIILLIIAAFLALCSVTPAQAFWRAGVWIDPWYFPYYYPYYPAPYYQAQPPVVIERQPAMQGQPAAPVQQYYWYYCPNPAGYYPYIKHCPTPWMKVVPSAPSQTEGAANVPAVPPDYKPGNEAPALPPQ